MAAPLEALYASDGVAPAVRATVSSTRLPGDMDIITDSVANWPHKGIATSGTPDDNGVIIPGTECVFEYVLSGTIIHITGFAPGYSDVGHEENQIVIIKPTTYHNDSLVAAISEGGASVTIGDTPPPDAEPGDLWGDTSDSSLNSIVVAVGSLLMPIGHTIITNNPANPATYYGFGTWEEDAEGRSIVGVDPNDSDFDEAGKTGGAKTHTLTQSQIPNSSIGFLPTAVPAYHSDWNTGGISAADSGKKRDNATQVGTTNNSSTQYGYNLKLNGGGQAHNNLPPYQTKYIWTRVA